VEKKKGKRLGSNREGTGKWGPGGKKKTKPSARVKGNTWPKKRSWNRGGKLKYGKREGVQGLSDRAVKEFLRGVGQTRSARCEKVPKGTA